MIFLAAIAWAIITILMPNLLLLMPRSWAYSLPFIVTVRIIHGAFQGVHFPSMISITSQVIEFNHQFPVKKEKREEIQKRYFFFQNLNSSERTSFFSLLTCGSALGTLLTGTLGSFILDYFGWPMVFRILGILALAWALMMRFYTMSSDRYRIINLSVPNRLCTANCTVNDSVPWLKLFSRPSFWACVLTHACENNCFFVLLSWLPTYFHDGFPHAKGWIVNMVPWLALPPCTLIGKYLTDYLILRNWPLTRIRKVVESACFLSQNVALCIMCRTNNFYTALTCMTIVIGGSGFHNNAVIVNPQDLAPAYSGSVFGLMNTFGAIPGKQKSHVTNQICVYSLM